MELARSHSHDGTMPLEDYEPLSISQSLSMPDLSSVSQTDAEDEPDDGAKLKRTVSLTEISAESGLLVVATLVFGCLAVVPLEMLNTRDRGCADLISLMEYSWAAIISLPALSRKQQIPWRYHVALLICGVTYSVCCNQALNHNLPMPVFLVLKNGLLVANMIVGRCALGKIYSNAQILAVLCVTTGLIVCTIVSGRDEIERAEMQVAEQYKHQLPDVLSVALAWLRSQVASLSQPPTAESMWAVLLGLRDSQFTRGVLFMLGALGARAIGSATQEVAFRTYGAHVQEAIFWKSILGLPVFAMRWDDVTSHASMWMETPFNWVLLAGEVAFDYTTSRSVANLVATTSGLTASLVLTIQRFLSLVFSAAVLNSPPPPPNSLWVGSGMVLLGSCMYILAPRAGTTSGSDNRDDRIWPRGSPPASPRQGVDNPEPSAGIGVTLTANDSIRSGRVRLRGHQ